MSKRGKPKRVRRRYKLGYWYPKTYYSKGRVLEHGKDLTDEQIKALEDGEVFTSLDEKGNPIKKVIMDSYGTIRESEALIKEKLQTLTSNGNE